MILICLEGPNCVGKTTLAKKIEASLNGSYPVTVLSDTNLEQLAPQSEDMASRYLSARKKMQFTYNLTQTDGRVVILERWQISSLVFDYFPLIEQGYPISSLLDPNLVNPDLTYVLLEEEKVLESRSKDRSCLFELQLPLSIQINRFQIVADALNLPKISTKNLSKVNSKILNRIFQIGI